uniref:Agenet-like domain-containing protein n=1 Tax=Brassica campestris TaxID=3711 RepID=A0A3P6BFZ8_BRACM|nr:unnamed protein product [Brassica rapa]
MSKISRVQNPFEIGANVEISSQDDNTCHKWYPGNVLATYLVDGVEMVKVEYFIPSRTKRRGKGVLRHVYQLTEYALNHHLRDLERRKVMS